MQTFRQFAAWKPFHLPLILIIAPMQSDFDYKWVDLKLQGNDWRAGVQWMRRENFQPIYYNKGV